MSIVSVGAIQGRLSKMRLGIVKFWLGRYF
jgi:hypothetical protein